MGGPHKKKYPSGKKKFLLFLRSSSSGIPEAFSKRIMINLELCDFLVLVSCYSDKLSLFEHVGPEGGVGKLKNITGTDQMKPRLVLVH